MDRRQFFSGIGTLGTLGAVAAGFATQESGAAKARASGLAQAAVGSSQASSPSVRSQPSKVLAADGMSLGYLPGSAGMFASPAVERLMQESATGLRWSTWDASSATQANQSAMHSLFKVGSLVEISIGLVGRSNDATASMVNSLDITAHFAIDDAPYFASFIAWGYQGSGAAAAPISTRFVARSPDRVALNVAYALHPGSAANGVSGAGNLYLPVGASAAPDSGLATGLYVLATPSSDTGVQADFGAHVFSGDMRAPIADPSGRALDFDYLTLAIRPVAI
jgi:hypothetical protein